MAAMTTNDTMPKAWADLLEALTLLAEHPADRAVPVVCEHDELTVNADPAAFTADEIARLGRLGFRISGGSFYSYVGSN